MYGPLHTEQDKIHIFQNNQWNFDKHMSLSQRAKFELEWWVVNVMTAKNVMIHDALMHNLTRDASNKDWGVVYCNQSTGTFWSSAEKNHHMGTRHFEQLNAVKNDIWDWCITRNLWISAGHHAGKSNVQADQGSRRNQTATEWMLQKTLLSHPQLPLV